MTLSKVVREYRQSFTAIVADPRRVPDGVHDVEVVGIAPLRMRTWEPLAEVVVVDVRLDAAIDRLAVVLSVCRFRCADTLRRYRLLDPGQIGSP